MPEVKVTIGGRHFDVACQEGEETFLEKAAGMLDQEAAPLVEQAGRLPADRMLLLAGLLLADRTSNAETKVDTLEQEVAALKGELEDLRNAPPPEPERIEVPVVPQSVSETLAELAARAEALAAQVEEKAEAN